MPAVSVLACETYALASLRPAVRAALALLGGIERFVEPGMTVLLKPNALAAAVPERAVTTHPALVQVVAELVREAGATVLVGDSPGGPLGRAPEVFRTTGIGEVATKLDIDLLPFDGVAWKRRNGTDYFIARPVCEADLVINLPKLKTHQLTLYTGAVKNLFGAIPGTRKSELHLRAPGIEDFSRILVDILELVPSGLTLMDGILGQEGQGPGTAGTPHAYGCLLAASDPVALDAVVAQALGYRHGQVRHLTLAGARGLGTDDPAEIDVVGDLEALSFGSVCLPGPHWYFHAPSWITRPATAMLKIRPQLVASACTGCNQCVDICPRQAIAPGHPPIYDLDECTGCLCCVEVCPQAAVRPRRGLVARLIGLGE